MVRAPAVAGQFYPAEAQELCTLVRQLLKANSIEKMKSAKACLVPHAGYLYSGAVAAAVFSRIVLPKKFVFLGVRHFAGGAALAICSEGNWRTPLGECEIDNGLAKRLREACPELVEDAVAHEREHSIEVELPFLQIAAPGFRFVPIAAGPMGLGELVEMGERIGEVIVREMEEVLLVGSTDLNHYENEANAIRKDHLAIERILKMDAKGLYDTCLAEKISMCGLGATVILLTALRRMGVTSAELERHATSADADGQRDRVVGYAGIIFE